MKSIQGVARFVPQRRDDLNERAAVLVGQELNVYWCGVMDEGVYDGQNIWLRDVKDDEEYVGWIPDCDLEWVIEPDWDTIEMLEGVRP